VIHLYGLGVDLVKVSAWLVLQRRIIDKTLF